MLPCIHERMNGGAGVVGLPRGIGTAAAVAVLSISLHGNVCARCLLA
jgi:hypothetical protein